MTESSTSDSAKIAIDNAIDLFDEIFYEIAPIDLYNEPNKGDKIKIPLKHLSDRQCHVIKQFSGYLSTARANLTTASVSHATTSPSKGNEAALVKKINCLREYLVNELNRSENAEQELKKKEEELVIVTAERDKLQRKLASALHANTSSSNQGSTARTIANVVSASVKSLHGDRVDSQPESYVNSYIRKPFGSAFFFGLVAQYDVKHAYFQIVYEDADYEDLSHAELRKVLWTGSTPNSKKEACMKHAKLLGIITEAQYAQMVEANKHSNASAGNSSGSLHSVGASSSSSMIGHVTAGRSTRHGGSTNVSAFDAHDSHTVSADDDNLENTSEPTHSPSASDRGSPLSLPKETSQRTAAPSGGAVPTRPIVSMVSDLSAGTDGDSRDSVVSLRSPSTSATASAGAGAGASSAVKMHSVLPTTATAASIAASKVNTSSAAASGAVAGTAAAKPATNSSATNAPVALAGALSQLTQLQAMLKPTPAAALGSVTCSEKVKPPAKSGLHQQQLKFTVPVSQTSTSSAEAEKILPKSASAPARTSALPASAAAPVIAAPIAAAGTSSGAALSKKELYYQLGSANSQVVPPPSKPASSNTSAKQVPSNTAPKVAAKSTPKVAAASADSETDESVVFIEQRASPGKQSGKGLNNSGDVSLKKGTTSTSSSVPANKVGQQDQPSTHGGNKGNISTTNGSGTGTKAVDGKQGKRKADVLTGKDALPSPPPNKKQNTTAGSSLNVAKASADYIHVVE